MRKEVELKGFLFQASDGRWILADTPNLKTCCIGKSDQLTLLGDFSDQTINAPLTVKGTLVEKNILSEVTVIHEKNGFPFITILIVLFGLFFIKKIYKLTGTKASSSLKR